MKTAVFVLLIAALPFVAVAQNNKLPAEFQNNYFNEALQKSIAESLKNSHPFSLDTSFKYPGYFQQLHDTIINRDKTYPFPEGQKYYSFELRMPVVGQTSKLKMPFAVPDSTVHYFIKEKRVEFINPLEHRHK